MRNISFALTTPQFLANTKDVTRRLGWKSLQPGTLLRAVRKSRGLRKGESPEPLGVIEILSVRTEPLLAIDQADVIREGYPDLTPPDFVELFAKSMGCPPDQPVQRVEFRRVPGPATKEDRRP